MRRLLVVSSLVAGSLLAGWDAQAKEPEYGNKPLSYWVKQLKDPSFLAREEAIEVLLRMGAEAKDAGPALEELLDDKTPAVRYKVALTLGKIGSNSKKAVPVLAEALKSADLETRKEALEAIAGIGPVDGETTPALLQALTDSDAGIRKGANQALAKVGATAAPQLIKALDHKEKSVRHQAMELLGGISPASNETLEAFTAKLKGEDPVLRIKSAGALWKAKHEADPILPVILEGSKSADLDIRHEANVVLFQIEPLPKEGLVIVREAIKDKDAGIRLKAAQALVGTEGDDRKLALTAATALLESDFKREAIQLIGKVGPDATDALPALVKVASGGDRAWYPDLGKTFVKIGKPAIPFVVQVLERGDPDHSEMIKSALIEIGPDSVTPVLKHVSDSNQTIRRTAIEVVAALIKKSDDATKAAKEIVPPLIEAMKSKDAQTRYEAGHLLTQFGAAGKDAVPVLTEWLKSQSIYEREEGARILRGFAAHAQEAVPALLVMLEDADSEPRKAAVATLEEIAYHCKESRPKIAEGMKEPKCKERARLAEVLWRVEPGNEVTMPALAALVKDRKTMNSACLTIERLGAEAKPIVPAMLEAWKEQPERSLPRLIRALGTIGPGAKDAQDNMKEALKSKNNNVRAEAAIALQRTGAPPKEFVEVLTELGGDRNIDYQLAGKCIDALGKCGKDAEGTVPALLKIMKESGTVTARHAARALVQVDPKQAKDAIPVLLEVVEHGYFNESCPAAAALGKADPGNAAVLKCLLKSLASDEIRERRLASEALAELGSAAKDAASKLGPALEDKDPSVRVHAATALMKMDKQDKSAMTTLIDAAAKPAPRGLEARRKAIQVLGDLGADGKDAVAALTEAYKDGYHREAALAALKKIDPEAANRLRSGATPEQKK